VGATITNPDCGFWFIIGVLKVKILQNTVARAVYHVAFGPDGRKLVTGGSGGLDIWDLTTDDHIHIPSPDVTNYICVCECDPLGRWFYVSDSKNGRMIPWSGRGERGLPEPPGKHIYGLGVSSEGSRLLLSLIRDGMSQLECWTTSEHPFSRVWGTRSGQPIDPLEAPAPQTPGWVFRAAALSRNGRLAASVDFRRDDSARLVALRDGNSGALLRDLGPVNDYIHHRLMFTPDGKTLISCDQKEVTFWDTSNGDRRGPFEAGRSKLHGLAVHPSGQFLVIASANKTARTWSLPEIRETQVLKWPVGKLSSIAFSPYGTLAAAGGEKGQVVVWDID
jgi:WD40 repeat protein